MKKIITLLFCLMFALGMIISCDNGEKLKDSDLKGYENNDDYEDVERPKIPGIVLSDLDVWNALSKGEQNSFKQIIWTFDEYYPEDLAPYITELRLPEDFNDWTDAHWAKAYAYYKKQF